jgi:hypothetical protein
MAGLLGDIFGAADTAKRKLRDVVANPLLSAQQFLGNVNDRARNLNEMTAAAALEGVDYGPASQRLGGLLAEGYNPVGMFIGPSSPMFNKQMAFEATKLSKRGKTPQEIWQQTGTVKGPDGQWRQEISDDVSTMKGSGEFGKTIMNAYERGRKKTGDQLYKTTVDDVFFHNQLSEAYPELMKIETQMMPKGKTARGSLSGTSDGQILRMQETLPSNDARSTMLHELQHGIQEREGFAVGGNTRDFAVMRAKALDQIGELNTRMSAIAKQLENKSLPKAQQDALRAQYDQAMEARQGLVSNASIDPMQAYGNLMGEAEARLTQRRMNLKPQQRRQNFPFEYTGETGYGLDVQPSGLIYMDQSGTILDRGLLGR